MDEKKLLEYVKGYLRIEVEFTEEDILIEGFIKEAKEYIKNAVGKEFNIDNKLYLRAIMLYVANAYENRNAVSDGITKSGEPVRMLYNMDGLLLQLRYCYE